MRRIRLSGKDLEVETQEGILKAGSPQSEAEFSTADSAPGVLRTLDRDSGVDCREKDSHVRADLGKPEH